MEGEIFQSLHTLLTQCQELIYECTAHDLH